MRLRPILGSCIACLVPISAHAQCPPDADIDGHPLYFSTYARADLTYFDDESHIARATDVAFGDLDGDGDLDAVFALADAGAKQILTNTYLSVILNRGDAVFGPPAVYWAGAEVSGVALADLDADGDLDVAATNARDDTVSVLLNHGDATLAEQTVYPVGTGPRSLVALDANADGLDDLAVLNVESEDVSILLATGDGGLAPEVRVQVGDVTPRGQPNETFPYPGPFMDAADIDGDGDVDLAVPCRDEVRILVNDGSGGFDLSPHVADVVNQDAYDVVFADLDADGRLDIATAVTDEPTTAVSITFQEEDGSWSAPETLDGDLLDCPTCFYFHITLAAGDIDADGDIDLVLSDEIRQYAGLFRNDGTGGFVAPELHFTHDGPYGAWVVELEDLNADGDTDMAFLNGGGRGALHVHLNDGNGTFAGPAAYDHTDDQPCQNAALAATADMDLDGHPDLVVAHNVGSCPDQISIHRNDGSGSFSREATVSLPVSGNNPVYQVVVGDLDADGLPDIIVPAGGEDAFEPGALYVARNTGGMTFAPVDTYPAEDSIPFWATLADFDADGDPDIAVWTRGVHPGDVITPVDRSIEIHWNTGDARLVAGPTILLEQIPVPFDGEITSADLNGDGLADLLATTGNPDLPGRLWALLNEGGGRFNTAQVIDVGMQPTAIAATDFDSDGDLDAALMFKHAGGQDHSKYLEPYLTIFDNDGTGTLTTAQEFIDPNIETNWTMNAADLNGDGRPDVALTDLYGSVRVHLAQDDGTLGHGTTYDGLGHFVQGQAIADFDADDRLDIALTGGDYVRTLFNRACPPCPADMNTDGTLDILDFVSFQQLFLAGDPAADCNDDGQLTNPADFVCYQQRFQAGCP